MTLEEIKMEANDLSVKELKESAEFCTTLTDSIVKEKEHD
jgi:hypothetical protein